MEKAKKLKRALPALSVALLLITLVVIALLPPINVRPAAPVAAANDRNKLDAEAMRVLGDVCAYTSCNDFTVKMNGEIKAKAFGIPYTQRVHGGRSVIGGVYSEHAESKSAFIKSAFRRKSADGGIEVSVADYKNKKFVYRKPKLMKLDAYEKKYGRPNIGIVRYELDGTVKQAVKVKDGVYKYKLDQKPATRYSRNEVKTLTDCKSYPAYESVSFTLYVDGTRPVKISSREVFRIDVCGGLRCTASYVETFDFGNKDKE